MSVLRTPSCVGFPASGSTAAVSITTAELEVDVLELGSLTFLIVGSFFFGGAGVGGGGESCLESDLLRFRSLHWEFWLK